MKWHILMVTVLISIMSGCGGGGGGGGSESTSTQTDRAKIALDALTFDDIKGENIATTVVYSDLSLPRVIDQDFNVTWDTSDSSLVDENGTVYQPTYTNGDQGVTLTAKVQGTTQLWSRDWALTVVAADATLQEMEDFLDLLSVSSILNGNESAQKVQTDLNLTSTLNGLNLSWESNNSLFLSSDGVVYRPASGEADQNVTVTATLQSGDVNVSKAFNFIIDAMPTDEELVAEAKASLTFDDFKGNNTDEQSIRSDLALPTTMDNGITVSWSSDDTTHLADGGDVTLPFFGEDNATVTLTATLSINSASDTKTFELKILAHDGTYAYDFSDGAAFAAIETRKAGTINLSINLGTSSIREVYFIFTNTNGTDLTEYPSVSSDIASSKTVQSTIRSVDSTMPAAETNVVINGKPEITAFNNNPFGALGIKPTKKDITLQKDIAFQEPLRDTEGGSTTFQDETNTSVSATCKKVVTANGKTLNIWVADDAWVGCSKAYCIDQTMVDTLADAFLKTGDDNDIYEWVHNIFGEEWEDTVYSDLIYDNNEITILLLDIDNDNSTTGGTLGFFYSRDNFTAAAVSGSNERTMFYLDSVLFADDDGDGSWSLDDFWPNKLLGTLAHEFQHMIHFYQKLVKNDAQSNSDTWINEMCSMVTEDLVATKINNMGPRYIVPNDGTAGSTGITQGRLPRYVQYDYLPLTTWFEGSMSNTGDDNVLNSYAKSYAFGAYLARNYGGAELFHRIVDSNMTDESSITNALHSMGYSDDTITTVLRKFGIATLISDYYVSSEGYRFNSSGGFIDTTYNGVTYSLGSINMFNYQWGTSSYGPKIFDTMPTSGDIGKYKMSNMFYQADDFALGIFTRDIMLPEGVQLSIVVK